jgi:hypothetical protein
MGKAAKGMGRKGFFLLSYYDFVAIILLILVVPFWLIILKAPGARTADVTTDMRYVEDDVVFMNILRTKVQGRIMLDYVLAKDESIKIPLEKILNESYGNPCYELKLDGDSFLKARCKKIQKDEVFFASVIVPGEEKAQVLELALPGYRE